MACGRVVRPIVLIGIAEDAVEARLTRRKRRFHHNLEGVGNDGCGHSGRPHAATVGKVRNLAVLAAALELLSLGLTWQPHRCAIRDLATFRPPLVHVCTLLQEVAHFLMSDVGRMCLPLRDCGKGAQPLSLA